MIKQNNFNAPRAKKKSLAQSQTLRVRGCIRENNFQDNEYDVIRMCSDKTGVKGYTRCTPLCASSCNAWLFSYSRY